jgi:hypothetical protein
MLKNSAFYLENHKIFIPGKNIIQQMAFGVPIFSEGFGYAYQVPQPKFLLLFFLFFHAWIANFLTSNC